MAFSFGGSTSGTGSGGGLFGTAGSSSSTPNQNNPGSTGGGIFGNVGAPAAATTTSSTPTLFGAPATSTPGQAGGSLFGSSTANTSGTLLGGGSGGSKPGFSFGAQSKDNTAQSLTPAASGTGFLTPNRTTEFTTPGLTKPAGIFGGTANSGAAPSNMFGSATPATSGGGLAFGNPSTTPAGPPPPGTSTGQGQSLFGAQQPQKPQGLGDTSNLFGAKPAATTAPAATTTTSNALSQGGTPQSQPTSNLFGSMGQQGSKPNPFDKPSPAGNLNNVQQPPSSQGTLGSTPLNPLANAPPLSGDSASKPSNLFGQASTTPKFPTTTPAGQPSSGGFSFPTANATSTTSTAAPTAAPAKTEGKSLFSNLGNNAPAGAPASTAAPSASNLFQAAGSAKSAPSLSAAPATTAATTTTQPGASGLGLFANVAKPATTTPASTTATSTTAAPAAPTTTQAAPTATAPAAAGPTLATAATTAATTAVPATSAPNLGASTAGPIPPAQSRLKNKTMDEIITRWATDLTSYQKEFQGQAEKVAMWDRMLVENSDKVQKLFANTVNAERATQEVERQLASVEGQQDELSAWLDRYEREVDDMTAKQVGPGEALQGPDQERERTYKLAEKLSDRLNDMGKDLTSMIEEVNGVSANLSKTSKPDEPISQIVRILNSHLSQLQLIDQGTATLQTKVAAAQKAGHSLGNSFGGGSYQGHHANGNAGGFGQSVGGGGGGGGGGGAVDDFYRSYMGRR